MITRNRIRFSEKQAALMWQQVLGRELSSSEGRLISVIYPGRANGDNGPDFRDAVIVDRSHLTKGDVEIHVKSSDWYSHEHHDDAAYNNVILHVVMWRDCSAATSLQNGKTVPVLCLAEGLRYQAYLLPSQLPCSQILGRADRQTLEKLLSTAGEERFKQKARHLRAEIKQREAGQVLFRDMMRALGYSKNAKPFEQLADTITLSSIESREGLALKQALLLGTAGLLPSQRRRGRFARGRKVEELEQMWQSEGKEIGIMKEDDWSLSGIYPNNSPARRLVALSYLLERYSEEKLLGGVLQAVKGAPLQGGHCVLENSLIVTGDGYWRDHFDLDVRSKTKTSAILGNSKAGELAVNVVLPFALSWGELASDAKLTEKATELYLNYPKLAQNCITRHMKKQLGLEQPFGLLACHQQGLIHIFRNYCREGECGQCPLVG